MSYQFPPDNYRLKFPPRPPVIDHTPLPPVLLIKSRLRCTITIDDGDKSSIVGEMELPDDGRDIQPFKIDYCERELNLEKILLCVPPEYHNVIYATLKNISPARYRNDISLITIEWTI